MNIIFYLLLSLYSNWFSYTLPDGAAKLSLPSLPKVDSLVIESEMGTLHQIKLEASELKSNARYLLIRTSYPKDLFNAASEQDSTKFWIDDSLVNGLLEQQDAHLIYQNMGILNGKPVKWALLHRGINTRIKICLIWQKHHHYALLCISDTTQPNKNEDQYFESFQLNEI